MSRGTNSACGNGGRDRRRAYGCIGRDERSHPTANIKLDPSAVSFGHRGVRHEAVQLLGHVVPSNSYERLPTVQALKEEAAKWAPILQGEVDLMESPTRDAAPALDAPDVEERVRRLQILDPVSPLRQGFSHNRPTGHTRKWSYLRP